MSPSESADDPRPPLRLLFVCSGNTCRSPLAEALARRIASQEGLSNLEVRSAGTSAVAGLPASEGARRAAGRHGFSLEAHRSSPLSGELVAWADVVLGMGPAHLQRVLDLGGGGKEWLLGAFAIGDERAGGATELLAVPDPFGGDDLIYEETYQTLERYVRRVIQRIREEVGS